MNINKEKVIMKWLGIGLCVAMLSICAGKMSFGADKNTEICTTLVQYMADYYKLYQASGKKTDPQQVSGLRTRVEHRLMDLGIQPEVVLALSRYEFACRSCFYLGWDSECGQIPHYSKAVVESAACVE
jgi:hypothetical protein